MIYISENIITPRTTKEIGDKIVFEDLTTHKIITIENIPIPTKFHYTIPNTSTEWTDGQYSYKIFNSDAIVESGICQYGEFGTVSVVEYNDNDNKYITYNYE